VKLLGAKNVGFKLLIASLLADSSSTIYNVANTGDVQVTREIIESLKGRVEFLEEHKVMVDPRGLNGFEVPASHGEKTRASTLCVGPLVARFGKAFIALPGGDSIGERPVDRHIQGFESLGLSVKEKNNGLEIGGGIKGGNYRFEKNSHTGTESLILAAVLAGGKTVLENAAAEPEVDDLIAFLNQMGAKIKRVQLRTIEIEGVKNLHGVEYRVMPDRNEAVTFACAALVTFGDIEIEEAIRKHLGAFEKILIDAGASFEFSKETLRVWRKEGQPLKATKVTTTPSPGFMTDWQPLLAVAATASSGESEIHETVFENRFKYVESLQKMGANIHFFEPEVPNPENFYNFNWTNQSAFLPHAIKIVGPTKLQGVDLAISDIRSGATITLAALAASGESVLEDIAHIERGYENLEGRLASLGAKIKRTD
jgi:UDP-N-acetylglucosamine 1-carboxyvinyltransferase